MLAPTTHHRGRSPVQTSPRHWGSRPASESRSRSCSRTPEHGSAASAASLQEAYLKRQRDKATVSRGEAYYKPIKGHKRALYGYVGGYKNCKIQDLEEKRIKPSEESRHRDRKKQELEKRHEDSCTTERQRQLSEVFQKYGCAAGGRAGHLGYSCSGGGGQAALVEIPDMLRLG